MTRTRSSTAWNRTALVADTRTADELVPLSVSETPESKGMSKALKARGFRFVGPTIVYAFMESAGLVNDHVTGCFRYREVARA